MGIFDFLGKKSDKNIDFIFKSSDHLRYENGRHVSGPHGGAGRAIKVEPNISGGKGFSVSMYNLDGPHPTWQNNIQMSPKQMEIISDSENKLVLRGFGRDSMGATFSDYGLTIFYQNSNPNKCILHMFDRNTDIEYLPYETVQSLPQTKNTIAKNEEDLKYFRIVHIAENIIKSTNQKIAVFQMSDIEYLDYLPGKYLMSYENEDDQYVIDFSSELAKKLINNAENEEVIALDLTEFTMKVEKDDGKMVIRYFHKSIIGY